MKKYLTAFFLSLLLALAALPARAGDDDALKKAIETRYWDMRLAIKSGDPERYKSNLAPGFTSIDLAGTVRDAQQVVDAIGQGVPDNSRKEKTTVTSLKHEGDSKVVILTNHDLTALRSRDGGGTVTLHMVTTSTDTWVKDKDTWLLQKTETNTGDVYVDDTKVAHRVRGEKYEPPPSPVPAPTDKAPAPEKK